MASVKGDGEGLVQGQTAVPGDSLGTATVAPNSHSAPSTKPGPNLDQLSTGTCICCVCCTSSRSYNHWPNAAAIPARLQESPADQIIKSMNEYQSQLCHAAASALLYPSACWAATASSTSRVGVPIPAPPACAFCSGCSPCVALVLPALCSLCPCEAFPPSHQQQVLSLRSNAGTESIPRQMFLRPLTQD